MANIGQEFCFLGFITLFSFNVDLEKIFSANFGESSVAIRRKKKTILWRLNEKLFSLKILYGFPIFKGMLKFIMI